MTRPAWSRPSGPACTLFKAGDEVFYAGSIGRPGTNAEFHLVDERIVGRKPGSLSFSQAAALPLTSITAWEMLFDRFGIRPGKPADAGAILIIGGAGGVGSIAIQLARRLTGLTVVATASRPETRQWALDLGAHQVIDHTKPLADGLKSIGLKAVEYIFCTRATGQHFPIFADIVAPQGKIGVIEGEDPLDARALMRKCASLHWELMFTRPLFETPDMIGQHKLLDEVSGAGRRRADPHDPGRGARHHQRRQFQEGARPHRKPEGARQDGAGRVLSGRWAPLTHSSPSGSTRGSRADGARCPGQARA